MRQLPCTLLAKGPLLSRLQRPPLMVQQSPVMLLHLHAQLPQQQYPQGLFPLALPQRRLCTRLLTWRQCLRSAMPTASAQAIQGTTPQLPFTRFSHSALMNWHCGTGRWAFHGSKDALCPCACTSLGCTDLQFFANIPLFVSTTAEALMSMYP